LKTTRILLDEQVGSVSSGKLIRRIVVEKSSGAFLSGFKGWRSVPPSFPTDCRHGPAGDRHERVTTTFLSGTQALWPARSGCAPTERRGEVTSLLRSPLTLKSRFRPSQESGVTRPRFKPTAAQLAAWRRAIPPHASRFTLRSPKLRSRAWWA
jgi:hypothetical protein